MSNTELPLQRAIRTVLDDVSYSNPLPDWYTPEEVKVSARKLRLSQRVASYLKGGKPLAALRVQVPSRSGELRPWLVPAVNDQMILQACVATLVDGVSKRFDAKHVFSCAPNKDPQSAALMKSQIAAWLAFQNETVKRVKTQRFILQFDIRKAFASIDRTRFFGFLKTLQPKGSAVDLIRHLIDSWSGNDPGLPLINDSLFFLGSSYFNQIDTVVARHSKNYIRFMDDYRVFGSSEGEFEGIFEKISSELAALGFSLNSRKVRLSSQKDYLEAVSRPRFESANQPVTDPLGYEIQIDTGISSQLEPPQVLALVAQALEKPVEYLNEGIGRYLLGALRRYRLNAAIRHGFGKEAEQSAPGVKLRQLLANDVRVIGLTRSRLSEYSAQPDQSWRLIWLIYLIEQEQAREKNKEQLAQLETDKSMPRVVQLWARRCREGRSGEPPVLQEDLHDLSYLDAGLRCYGDTPCKGEGF